MKPCSAPPPQSCSCLQRHCPRGVPCSQQLHCQRLTPSCMFICLYLKLLLSLCVYWCSGCSCTPRILNHWEQSLVQISWQFLSRWQKSCPSRKHRRSQTRRTTPVEEKPACHFLDRGLFKKETICARPVPPGHQDFFSHLNGHHRSSQALFKLNEEQMHLKLSWFVLLDLTYSK